MLNYTVNLHANVRKLYYLTTEVQKTLNRIFFYEFMELDAAEEENDTGNNFSCRSDAACR